MFINSLIKLVSLHTEMRFNWEWHDGYWVPWVPVMLHKRVFHTESCDEFGNLLQLDTPWHQTNALNARSVHVNQTTRLGPIPGLCTMVAVLATECYFIWVWHESYLCYDTAIGLSAPSEEKVKISWTHHVRYGGVLQLALARLGQIVTGMGCAIGYKDENPMDALVNERYFNWVYHENCRGYPAVLPVYQARLVLLYFHPWWHND